jgi:uncharacterized Fe-S cluster-containing radical SAM superfamily protein
MVSVSLYLGGNLMFDPIQRSKDVESIVMKGDQRAYYRFRHAPFYGEKGIVTADAMGCNFLCAYCWNYTRNEHPKGMGSFHSPSDVAHRLQKIAAKKQCNQFRLSGSEPILGEASASHIAEVIKLCSGSWVIETNGLMLGYDLKLLDLFPKDVFWRVTIKATGREMFEKVTGAMGEFAEYPVAAITEMENRGLNLEVAYNKKYVPDVDWFRNFNCEFETTRFYPGVKPRMVARGLV